MPKQNVSFSLDTEPMAAANGVIEGTLNAIESNIYTNYFVNYGLDTLRSHFNKEFILVASGNPKKYHHVFEWESLTKGVPVPLYRLKKTGRGKSRLLTYDFLQSRRNVPLPKGIEVSGHTLRRHVFKFKALVMETGTPVTIVPKEAKKLLIPNKNSPRGFVFLDKSVVKSPGGSATTGAFGSFWTQWFAGRGEVITKKEIVPKAEYNIIKDVEAGMRTVRTSSKTGARTFSLNAATEASAMKRQEQRMLANAAKYFRSEDDDD